MIETKNATIDTMVVTIRVLHVGGRQMTLSIFRQLPVASAYNDDGTLAKFEHWGLVRYSVKDETDLWLVASLSGLLYRCRARPQLHSVKTAKDMLHHAICERDNYEKLVRLSIEYKATKEADYWTTQPSALYSYVEGRTDYYESMVEQRSIECGVSRRAEKSFAVINALPQLFIAA